MNFRPAGYSSDEEEDEYEKFSFHGDTKSEREKREEIATEIYNERLQIENTVANRLYKAVIKGNLEQIKEELKSGFDINSPVSSDWTALFLATTQCNPEVVEELLSNGADVKLTRGIIVSFEECLFTGQIWFLDGFTPVMAVCNCLKDSVTVKDVLFVVNLLLKHGIDVKAKDRKRKTAFMYACSQGFIEVVKLLRPLVDLEDKDNQGWTALFYAANENEVEIADYLVKQGANVDHIDVRNNNVTYYAMLNDFTGILDVLPKSDFDIGPDDFTNNVYDYESVFELLHDDERPDFKPDIAPLLFGMKCQNFIPILSNTDIDLSTFLTLNEEQLKELGVSLQFQRNRILQGLYNFHKYTWKKKSIPFIPLNETFTTHDVFVTIVNSIKHLIVLESTIKYLKQNFDLCDTNIKRNIISTKTFMCLRKINRVRLTIDSLQKKALQYDMLYPGPADLITTKTHIRKNKLNKTLVLIFTGIAAIAFFRHVKNHVVWPTQMFVF